jgi:hypothetical protein
MKLRARPQAGSGSTQPRREIIRGDADLQSNRSTRGLAMSGRLHEAAADNFESGISVRLGMIELMLKQVLEELSSRKRRGGRRGRSATARAYDSVVSDPNYKPTELQVAAARRALARIRGRQRR